MGPCELKYLGDIKNQLRRLNYDSNVDNYDDARQLVKVISCSIIVEATEGCVFDLDKGEISPVM